MQRWLEENEGEVLVVGVNSLLEFEGSGSRIIYCPTIFRLEQQGDLAVFNTAAKLCQHSFTDYEWAESIAKDWAKVYGLTFKTNISTGMLAARVIGLRTKGGE